MNAEPRPRAASLQRLYRAAGYSLAGLASAWRSEASFRLEVALAAPLLPLALWFGENGVERALLIASWLAVMVVELLNSAIEAAIDRIGPERHPLSKRAKDVSSGAVLLTLVAAATVWLLVLTD